jgi:hypothetical protein
MFRRKKPWLYFVYIAYILWACWDRLKHDNILNLKLLDYKNHSWSPIDKTRDREVILHMCVCMCGGRWADRDSKCIHIKKMLTFLPHRTKHKSRRRKMEISAWRCRMKVLLLNPGKTWWATHFFRAVTLRQAHGYRSCDVTSCWSQRCMTAASTVAHTAITIAWTGCLWTNITMLDWKIQPYSGKY